MEVKVPSAGYDKKVKFPRGRNWCRFLKYINKAVENLVKCLDTQLGNFYFDDVKLYVNDGMDVQLNVNFAVQETFGRGKLIRVRDVAVKEVPILRSGSYELSTHSKYIRKEILDKYGIKMIKIYAVKGTDYARVEIIFNGTSYLAGKLRYLLMHGGGVYSTS